MKNISNNVSKLVLGLLVLAMFAGCDLLKKKGEESATSKPGEDTVLLSINGKVVLKESDFNKHLTQMLQVNPYLKGAKPETLPAPLKERFFSELVRQELILAWAEKNAIEKEAEFLKSYEDMIKLVKRSLLVQAYENKLFKDLKVEEKDVLDFYEKNKNKFIKEGTGGVTVLGVNIAEPAKAAAFIAKVKGKAAEEFAKIAQEEHPGKFRSFGVVKQDTNPMECPKEIKELAISSTKLPMVTKVVVGKNPWIIYVSAKKAPEFEAIDAHKAQIENFLKSNKFGEILKTKLEELKKDFKVEQNENFFKGGPAQPNAEAQPAPVVEQDKEDKEPATQAVQNGAAPEAQTAA